MLTKLFLTVLNMSLTGGLTVAVVLLVRLALKRAPKVFSYALWAVVLLRLLCPVMLSSPLSLWNLTKPADAVRSEVQQVLTVRPAIPAVTPPAQTPVMPVTPAVVPTAMPQPIVTLSWVWLVGAVALAAYSLWKLLRLRRRLIGAIRLEPGVYLADGIDTPFVMGLFRPKIYLPFALSAREREYILLHERHHILRGDHAVKLLAFLALCLHWFDPLVWLAFVLAGQDMEMSCDEAVLKAMGEDIRADYSASLLSLATGRRILAGTPLAFGEGDPRRRIKNVLNYKKPAFWIVLAAVITCVAAAAVLLTDPVKQQDDPAADDTPVSAAGSYMMWFDWLGLPTTRPKDEVMILDCGLPREGVTLRFEGDVIYAIEDGVERTVVAGMPIWNAYLLDLNDDGAPELCTSVSYGSGLIDEHIVVYDYINDATYTLWDSGVYDYTLEETDGRLSVVQWNYDDGSAQAAAWPLVSLDDLKPTASPWKRS